MAGWAKAGDMANQILSFQVDDGDPQAVRIYSTLMATAFANAMGSIPSEGLAAKLMVVEVGVFMCIPFRLN
jgi:hypothetical protein